MNCEQNVYIDTKKNFFLFADSLHYFESFFLKITLFISSVKKFSRQQNAFFVMNYIN